MRQPESRARHRAPARAASGARIHHALRVVALGTLVAVTLGLSPPVLAQGVLGNLLRNAFNPAGPKCRTLLEWVRTPVPAAQAEPLATDPAGRRAAMQQRALVPGGLDARQAHLLSDEVFSKHFGKTYEQLTMQDFRDFQTQTARACMQGGEFTPAEWQTVNQLWNEHQQARLVQALQARRAQQAAAERDTAQAQEALQRLGAELQQATPQSTSIEQLRALRDRARALAPRAGAAAQQSFDETFRKVAESVVPELLRQRVQQALSQARAPEHLPQLLAARDAVGAQATGLGVGLAADDPLLLQLQQRERELVSSAAAAERQELDAFADGLPGLEAGVLWHRRFQSRWAGLMRAAPELAAVETDFRQRRETLLSGAGPQLQRVVQQAATVAEAQAAVGRFTLPFEARLASVQGMQAAVAERVRLIERNDALGRATAPGPAAVAPPAPAAVAAAPEPSARPQTALQPPTAVAAGAGAAAGAGTGGEPSEEVMYDLVRQKFENAAARTKGLYDQCRGGGNAANPMNSMMCLTLNMQRGMTGGALAMPTRIEKFSKIGCAAALGRPGFNCEYEIRTDSAMDKQFIALTGFQLDKSGVGIGRFVRNREGRWLMITGD